MTPNRELLLDLREALLTLSRRNWKKLGFNMRYWAKGLGKPLSPDLGCGTMCCAYGLGTTLPSWIIAGLELIFEDPTGMILLRDGQGHIRYSAPNDSRYKLGLTKIQWDFLFGIQGYKTKFYDKVSPDDVASHIDYLLDGNDVASHMSYLR